MLSSFCSVLSVSSVIVEFIALHYTYAHNPILILIICLTHLISISHTVLFHITCVNSFPEWDCLLLYPVIVSLVSVSIDGSSHVYMTRHLASSQIVNLAIFPPFVLRYCSCLPFFHRWFTAYAPVTHTLAHATLLSPCCPL